MKQLVSNYRVVLNFVVLLSALFFFSLFSHPLLAASLDSPAAVTDAASGMYTTTDIYNRLNAGTAGSQRTTTFTEPSAAPTAATAKDLNEIMSVAPSVDDVNGAIASDVVRGKTYWGLQSGNWGQQTGSRYTAPVVKTGQNLCYKTDATNGTISCDATTGQDGDTNMQIGIAQANPRFTKNVNSNNDNGNGGGVANNGICDGTETCNGTVTDNSTGLIWLAAANCANAIRTWAQAFTDITSLNTNGSINANSCGDISNAGTHQTDWRLPNVRELHSLIDYQNYFPALPTAHPFSSVATTDYWSSTTNENQTNHAWLVGISEGYIDYLAKDSNSYVWPVRGGQ